MLNFKITPPKYPEEQKWDWTCILHPRVKGSEFRAPAAVTPGKQDQVTTGYGLRGPQSWSTRNSKKNNPCRYQQSDLSCISASCSRLTQVPLYVSKHIVLVNIFRGTARVRWYVTQLRDSYVHSPKDCEVLDNCTGYMESDIMTPWQYTINSKGWKATRLCWRNSFIGCVGFKCGRQTSKLRRNLLSPFLLLSLNAEPMRPSEMFVKSYQTTRRHNQNRPQSSWPFSCVSSVWTV